MRSCVEECCSRSQEQQGRKPARIAMVISRLGGGEPTPPAAPAPDAAPGSPGSSRFLWALARPELVPLRKCSTVAGAGPASRSPQRWSGAGEWEAVPDLGPSERTQQQQQEQQQPPSPQLHSLSSIQPGDQGSAWLPDAGWTFLSTELSCCKKQVGKYTAG